MVLSIYGLRIGVRADDSDLRARAFAALPAGRVARGAGAVDRVYSFTTVVGAHGTPAQVRLCVNDSQLITTAMREQAAETFELDLHRYLAEFARTHILVHAGVVGWQGRACCFRDVHTRASPRLSQRCCALEQRTTLTNTQYWTNWAGSIPFLVHCLSGPASIPLR